MKKSKRIVIAKDTLEILKRGWYKNDNNQEISVSKKQKEAVKNTFLYTPENLLELIERPLQNIESFQTKFEVNNLTTLDSVRKESVENQDVVCLNFASARNPGGGFLNGSQAQEESIARATGLYPCLLKAKKYYVANREITTCLYTDNIIYAPKVPILKFEDGTLMNEPILASIITAPAVNTGVVLRNEPQNISKIERMMRRRIDMVLAICKAQKHKTIVLGAWGCGVFRNDPKVIAGMFGDLLFGKYKNQFEKVIFSVYAKDTRFIEPFFEVFGER